MRHIILAIVILLSFVTSAVAAPRASKSTLDDKQRVERVTEIAANLVASDVRMWACKQEDISQIHKTFSFVGAFVFGVSAVVLGISAANNFGDIFDDRYVSTPIAPMLVTGTFMTGISSLFSGFMAYKFREAANIAAKVCAGEDWRRAKVAE